MMMLNKSLSKVSVRSGSRPQVSPSAPNLVSYELRNRSLMF